MKKTILLLFLSILIICCSTFHNKLTNIPSTLNGADLDLKYDPSLKPFYFGVASGDPLKDAVIIWTRVSPDIGAISPEIVWQISTDKNFSSIEQSGRVKTDSNKDYTVKIDVKGLEADTYYYYRFKYGSDTSMVGRTKTAPAEAESLKFAVASCSNYEWGYFNAYGRMAEEVDLNAVIHLGDYIYEHGIGVYGDTTIGRYHYPAKEIVSLSDYRKRYSQYRSDPDLMEAHRMHPFIAIWDDHEITNNAYKDGAQNHQEDEGDYLERRAIAKQVYYEWMPIRESKTHYRKLSFGDLADLFMLDERLAGRTKQPDSIQDPRRLDPQHSILGEAQFIWLENSLKESEALWKLIGNQVIFSRQDWGLPNFRLNMDSWDGYPKDQKRLADFLRNNDLKNTVFLTGDTHTSWAFEATEDPFNSYDPRTSEGAIAIELGVTSITSANSNESNPDNVVLAHEKKLIQASLNPHLKYVNRRDHGYLLLELTDDQLIADFKIIPTTRYRSPEISTDKKFIVKTNSYKLREF